MARRFADTMVVIADGHPNSDGVITTVCTHTQRPIALAADGVETVAGVTEVFPAGRRGLTIDAAFNLAAEEGTPWVAMRRDRDSAQTLIADALAATAKRATKNVPGFAVVFGPPQHRPIERILAVLDQADGQPSGLLALIAVSAASATGAKLDVLHIGAPGEAVTKPEVADDLQVERDQDLYARAVQRSREEGVNIEWFVHEDVSDKRAMVLKQISEGGYDVVIDDLGAIKLGGRWGRGGRIARALSNDGPGGIARSVLEWTDVTLVLVLDAVRLGMIPPAVVKGGAGAVLAFGVLASMAPAASASGQQRSEIVQTVTGAVDDYTAALDRAADMAAPAEVAAAEDAAQAAAAQAEATLTGSAEQAVADQAEEGADSADQAAESASETTDQAAPVPEAADQATPPAPDAAPAAEEGDTAEAAPAPDPTETVTVAPRDVAPEAVAPAPAPPVDTATIAPPADVTADTVAAAVQAEQASAAALQGAQAAFGQEQAEALAIQQTAADAATASKAAADALDAATEAYEKASAKAEAVIGDSAGILGLLTGGSQEDVDAAEAAQAQALADVADATEQAQKALDAYEQAASADAAEDAELQAAAAAVTAADGAHQAAAATTATVQAAYDEVMAHMRITPIADGQYNRSAHFGDSGSHWSLGYHTGEDFAAPQGTDVRAAASGRVVEAGFDGAYGNRVVIEHEGGYFTTYNHMSAIGVEVGDHLTAGDHVGAVGDTGNSFGAHLHFEVTRGGDGWSGGSFVDPDEWLSGAVG